MGDHEPIVESLRLGGDRVRRNHHQRRHPHPLGPERSIPEARRRRGLSDQRVLPRGDPAGRSAAPELAEAPGSSREPHPGKHPALVGIPREAHRPEPGGQPSDGDAAPQAGRMDQPPERAVVAESIGGDPPGGPARGLDEIVLPGQLSRRTRREWRRKQQQQQQRTRQETGSKKGPNGSQLPRGAGIPRFVPKPVHRQLSHGGPGEAREGPRVAGSVRQSVHGGAARRGRPRGPPGRARPEVERPIRDEGVPDRGVPGRPRRDRDHRGHADGERRVHPPGHHGRSALRKPGLQPAAAPPDDSAGPRGFRPGLRGIGKAEPPRPFRQPASGNAAPRVDGPAGPGDGPSGPERPEREPPGRAPKPDLPVAVGSEPQPIDGKHSERRELVGPFQAPLHAAGSQPAQRHDPARILRGFGLVPQGTRHGRKPTGGKPPVLDPAHDRTGRARPSRQPIDGEAPARNEPDAPRCAIEPHGQLLHRYRPQAVLRERCYEFQPSLSSIRLRRRSLPRRYLSPGRCGQSLRGLSAVSH
mmetsp:Transcript_3340/g.8910  ORF Transcript_3340/g.8910 Transcript_3340/m.8910 type:complete len:528 (+) Transcript_3340:205-1788(+)